MFANPFTDAELDRRLARVRARMAERDLDLAIVSSPENVFYLTGLDHWGYFAPHLLIIPATGDMILITRAMEAVTIANQVRNAVFLGHSDSETCADAAIRHLAGPQGRIGRELWGNGLSHGLGMALDRGVGARDRVDIGGMIDALRHVKSTEEQALMRRAATVSDAATAAAIAAIGDGAREADVAAECLAAMTRAGGTPPGFGPFIRPGARLGEEHTTWGDGRYRRGERVFLEIAGCVSRYNAPQGRLVHVGRADDADAAMAEVCAAAFGAVLSAMKPGVMARDVYAAWQAVVDAAGLAHYTRHHCGYLVGIGFPPSWTGGNSVVGLRRDSDMVLEEGMTFHILSWLMNTGAGDFFSSDCVLLGREGAERLTRTSQGLAVA